MDRVDMEDWLWNYSYQQMSKNWWQRCECHPSYKPMKTFSYTVHDKFAVKWEWNKGWKHNAMINYKDYEVENGKLCKVEK